MPRTVCRTPREPGADRRPGPFATPRGRSRAGGRSRMSSEPELRLTSGYRGPEVAPVASKAAQLRRLELMVTIRLDGLLRGEFVGLRSGPGSETAGSRAYDVGDDARRIDWNL